ncbi:MAG: type II/IV secretion system ATPase subunit [Nitrososphaeria archaeon]|nr:type II/IV secretion system ATPase subunit [Conexivisphaerales archaeon]
MFWKRKKENKPEEEEKRPEYNVQFVDLKKIESLGNVYVGIATDEHGDYIYYVLEPTLSPDEIKLIDDVKKYLFEKINYNTNESEDQVWEKMKKLIDSRLKELKMQDKSEKVYYYIKRDLLGYGKIDVMLHDEEIEDISCNGPNIPVYVWHRFYESLPSNVHFSSKEELDSFILKLAYKSGRTVSFSNPLVDATLPEGHRIQITLGGEVTGRGTNFTIRKFRTDPITIIDLINFKTLTAQLAAYLWIAIEHNMSLLIAGGTASGKTTTLNALTVFIPINYKVITIEDTRELNLYRQNWIASVTREVQTEFVKNISLFDLLKEALRQRPDVIIVGEVRGEEAYTLLQAIATGHGGLSSIHAETIEAVIERLSTKPMNIPKDFIASTLNMIGLQLRVSMQKKVTRRMIELAEIVGYDSSTENVIIKDSFKWDPTVDDIKYSGESRIAQLLEQRYGISRKDFETELQRREIYLRWMSLKGIRRIDNVIEMINNYRKSPEESYYLALNELESMTKTEKQLV